MDRSALEIRCAGEPTKASIPVNVQDAAYEDHFIKQERVSRHYFKLADQRAFWGTQLSREKDQYLVARRRCREFCYDHIAQRSKRSVRAIFAASGSENVIIPPSDAGHGASRIAADRPASETLNIFGSGSARSRVPLYARELTWSLRYSKEWRAYVAAGYRG